MYDGGLEQVSIIRLDDHRYDLRFGKEKVCEFEINKNGIVATHKPRKEKPVAVDAVKLIKMLNRLLAG